MKHLSALLILALLAPQSAINPKFIIKDGGVWPEEFYLQTEDAKIDIPVEKPSGLTSTFLEEAFAYPDSDVCVRDKTFIRK